MNRKKNILFVDDEQNVLKGLRRAMRSMQPKWDMHFAGGCQEAIELLNEQPFDVVVSDLRMPGMAGNELLQRILEDYPGTVRIILSGQASDERILKCVGPVHQFIQKPCDEHALKTAICRALDLGDLFADKKIKSMVVDIESLPSLPSHHQELLAQFQNPDVTPHTIGKSIGQDMAMTAKILHLVNSAFFGLCRRVETPEDAVKLLGMETVRSLVIAMQVFSQVSSMGLAKGFSQDSLLMHGIEVAGIAKRIAQEEGMSKEDCDTVYLAGLLHDIGILVLAIERPDEYAEVIALSKSESLPLEQVERESFGVSHAVIGAYLLTLWAFDIEISNVALFHHRPSASGSSDSTLITVVHVANAIVRCGADDINPDDLDVDREYLDGAGVADRLETWCRSFKEAA